MNRNMIHHFIIFICFAFSFPHQIVGGAYCPSPAVMQNDAAVSSSADAKQGTLPPPVQSTASFRCPKPTDPYDHTECCPDNSGRCCPSTRKFYEIDNTLATIISVVVILVCVAIAICMVICCFWSPCPLYTSCRMRYTHDVASCASKLGEIKPSSKETLKKSVQVISAPSIKNGPPLQVVKITATVNSVYPSVHPHISHEVDCDDGKYSKTADV